MALDSPCPMCGAEIDEPHSVLCPLWRSSTPQREEESPDAGDAGDPAFVRKRISKAKQREAAKAVVIKNVMGSVEGRSWIFETLAACHVYQTSFDPNALNMAFAEGERNIGLKLVFDVQRVAPEAYFKMIEEANGDE